MPEIITRSQAKAGGMNRYFTGKPCKHGHFCERYVVRRLCVECALENARAYKAKMREEINRRRRFKYQTDGDFRKLSQLRCREMRLRLKDDLEFKKRKAEQDKKYWSNPKNILRRNSLARRKYREDEKYRLRLKRNQQAYLKKHPGLARRMSRNNYLNGPKNPEGELQWLRKNQAQLRGVKRFLRNRNRPSEAQP